MSERPDRDAARLTRVSAAVTFVLFLMFVSALQATDGTHYTWFTNALGIGWIAATLVTCGLAILEGVSEDA